MSELGIFYPTIPEGGGGISEFTISTYDSTDQFLIIPNTSVSAIQHAFLNGIARLTVDPNATEQTKAIVAIGLGSYNANILA